MSSIQQAKESAVRHAAGMVKMDFRNLAKAAILGGEAELQALLQVLPGSPAMESLVGRKIMIWVDMKKIDILLAQIRSGMNMELEDFDNFIMATLNDLGSVPDDGEDDFHPSRTLLSATLRIDVARKTGAPTDYSAIGQYDPALWAHPLVADESSSTRKWYTGKGRNTPVPHPLQIKLHVRHAAPRQGSQPLIAQPHPVRPQATSILASSSDPIIEPDRGRPDSRRARNSRMAMRSRSRTGRFKSAEYVESSGDEMDVIDVKKKGKGKEVEVDNRMDIDEPISSQLPDAMNVDASGSEPIISSHTSIGKIRIKPTSKRLDIPPIPEPANIVPVAPADGPCERCFRLKKTCLLELEGLACLACKSGKIKCSLVKEGWRSMYKHEKSGEGETSGAKRSRKSDVRQAKTEKVERATTPRAERSKTPRAEGVQPARSSARSKSRARSVGPIREPSSTPLPVPPPQSVPNVCDLGQVPGEYVYILSREGQHVSAGIRLQTSNDLGRNDDRDEKMEQLEKKMLKMEEKNVELEERLRLLMEDITTLKNTITMLVAGQNGHSAMIESHRRLLTGPISPNLLEGQHNDSSPSMFLPAPPTTTPDPILADTGLVLMPPTPPDPELWTNLLNLGNYGGQMDSDYQSEASSHFQEVDELGGQVGGP